MQFIPVARTCHTDDGQDRAKNLLLVAGHVRGHIVNDGGIDVVTALKT